MDEFYLLNEKGLFANHWTFQAPNVKNPGHVIAFASMGDLEYVQTIDNLVKKGQGLVDIAVVNKIEMIEYSVALSMESDFQKLPTIVQNFPLFGNSQDSAQEFVKSHLTPENQALYQKVQSYLIETKNKDMNAVLQASEASFFDQGIMLAAQRILGTKLNMVDFVHETNFYQRILKSVQYECIGLANPFPEPFNECAILLSPEGIQKFNAQATLVLQFLVEFFERYCQPDVGQLRKLFAEELKSMETYIREQGGIPGFDQQTIQQIAEWIAHRISNFPNLVICFSVQRLPLIDAIFDQLKIPLTLAEPIPIIKF